MKGKLASVSRLLLRGRRLSDLKNTLPLVFMLVFSMAALNLSARLLGEERHALELYQMHDTTLDRLEYDFHQFEARAMASFSVPDLVDEEDVVSDFSALVSSFDDFVSQARQFSTMMPVALPVIQEIQDEFVYLGALLEQRGQQPDSVVAERMFRRMSVMSKNLDRLVNAGMAGGSPGSRQEEQRIRHAQITWSVFVMGLSGFVLMVVLIDKLSTLRALDTEKRETLRILEQRLAAMSAAFDGINIMNKDGVVTYVNNSLVSFYGYGASSELVGQSWEVLYDDIQVRWFYDEVLPLVEKEGQWHGHTKGRKKDGSSFFLDLSLTRLPGGGYVGVMRDVTELMQVEALSKRRLAAIEAAGDGIGIFDEKGTISFLNRALMEIHGIPVEKGWAYKGKPWTALYDEQTANYLSKEIMPFLKGKGYWRGERKVRRKSGDSVWVEISFTVLPEGGFINTSVDVTERKQADEEREILQEQFFQAQKMEAIGRLAGGIAHDFNNVLAAIMGYAEFLHEDLEHDPAARKHAANILQAGAQARQLVDQMLQFSRRKESAKANINAAEVLGDVLDIIRASFPKTIDVRTEFAIESARIHANRTQVAQVLMNLCVNARDALEDEHGAIVLGFDEIEADPDLFEEMVVGGGEEDDVRGAHHMRIYEPDPGHTYLELGRMSQGALYAVLSVEDTGSGIGRPIMEHMFEPFFTTKPVEKGTGLGLSNVHGIVLGHGGALTISSRLGEGTRFDVFFPIEEEPTEKPDVGSMPVEFNGGGRVLIVEDQKNVREMLETMLTRLGFEWESCESGLIALQKLRKGNPGVDLVITDHSMPGMTGLELAEQARIAWADLPFVMVSGYGVDALGGQGPVESIKAIIRKPVSRQEIEEAVKRALAGRSV
ncbi:MAG: PAS domain S-box protein [Alphaproteobacteria bacterium]|nr:PAS domain S-box protein [Alphaproteobacteria bacterium]